MNIRLNSVLAAAVLSLASNPATAAHSDSHVRSLANTEITKRAPYAYVRADGTVSRNSGIVNSNVSNPSAGLYCFNVPSIRGGQVTVDFKASTGFEHGQIAFGTFDLCPIGTTFFVTIMDANAGTFNNAGFFLRLYK